MRGRRIGFVILGVGVLLLMGAGVAVAGGAVRWDLDGVPICTASGSQYEQSIVSYNNNGTAVVWTDTRNQATTGKDIYTQYVQSDGFRPWTLTVGATQGVSVCAAAADQYDSVVCASGGSLFYAWVDERNYATLGKDIWAQRVDSNGAVGWPVNGYPVCQLSGNQASPQIVQDDNYGTIIVWEAEPLTGTVTLLFAEKLNFSGTPQWPLFSTGVQVCLGIGNQRNQAVIPDGAGGAIIVWEDHRNDPTDTDIYAQRLNSTGARLWTSTGVPICTAAGAQFAPQLVSDGSQGAIIVWHDRRGTNDDVYAQRVYSNGTTAWAANGVPVCTAAGDQQNPRIIGVNGQYVIAWRDYRGGGTADVYAQRISGAGSLLWAANGVPICTEAGDQAWPTMAVDDETAGTVIIAWQDDRSGIPGEFDIYAQHVRSDGAVDWTLNGIPVCTAPGDQEAPVSAADAHAGTIIVWQDGRGRAAPDIGLYGQRIQNFPYGLFLPLVRRSDV